VALLARRKDRLDALNNAIGKAGGQSAVWQLDVTDRKAVERAAAEVVAKFGRVDIVVNNAGVMLPNPIETKRVEQWQQQIDLNISGLMNVIGAFTTALLEAGAGPGPADLVNISSIADSTAVVTDTPGRGHVRPRPTLTEAAPAPRYEINSLQTFDLCLWKGGIRAAISCCNPGRAPGYRTLPPGRRTLRPKCRIVPHRPRPA